MIVISFVTQKGGSGKTTLAINCAVAAEQRGAKVLLLDLDTQGTAEDWFQTREAETPHLVRVLPGDLEKALNAARASKFDVVLIDTPGRESPGATAAIGISDLCVIPCRPSPADMKATPATLEAAKRLEKPAAFVLTQTPARSYRNREAEAGLAMFAMVAPVHVVMRNAYQDAQGAGLSVLEFEPDGKAAEEIRELWQWITKKVGKVRNGKEAKRT